MAATLAFTAFEVFAGLRSNSLSLLSDAGHNFTDAFALLLAAIGVYMQAKPADAQRTFGYHRAGVVTAFLNAATLVLISLGIFYEAVVRLLHPQPVDDTMMFWVALAALVLNGGIMLALNSRQKDDLNLRAAFIHMLGDALGAAAIIIGALVIRYTHWTYIDPILSIALGGLILYSAWDIIQESLNILLEGLPRGLELPAIATALTGINGVLDVHDLHVWSIGSNTHALCSHVLIDDVPPSESDAILKRINTRLCSLGIHHSTIQFEHVPCVLKESPCRMGTDHVHEDHVHGHDHHH
jgi:cobalt-zinc-cadmium efflux system protein